MSPDGTSPEHPPLHSPARALVVSALVLSGAAALAYEVAWSRALLLLLGSTATASAVVLATFVGALGIGARWGGRIAERTRRTLRLYGMLEVGAALWAMLAQPIVSLLEAPYVALAAGAPAPVQMVMRICTAAIVVAPAAFLLGATLPVIVRFWMRTEDETGRHTAWLYGANTIGAVFGCLFTGYVGVAAFGVLGAVGIAAAIGATVGLTAVLLGSRRLPEPVPAPDEATVPMLRDPEQDFHVGRAAAQAAFLCGFIGLAIEVVGFRILIFFIEGFTVTFASMLGVFIAGLGIGSLLLGPPLARTRRPAHALGVLMLLAGGTQLVNLYLVVPSLEDWMRSIRAMSYAGAASPGDIAVGLRVSSLLGAAALLFLPALILGPTFPLCVRWAEMAGDAPGHAVGRVYLWNSLGSLLAPFLLTFAVVPIVHVTGAWVLVLTIALGTALGFFWLQRCAMAHGGLLRLAALMGLALGVLVLMLDVPGTRPEDLVRASVVLKGKPDRRLVRVASDAVTTASVVENRAKDRYLYTDDFAAAATGRHYRYMRMLGHLPAVLAHRPKNAMVIGFGTGTTAGAVAEHADVERIEVVEVSSAVLDLASSFSEANRFVLDDKRVVVVRDDGRNALLLHEPDLDLITLEPLMPYSPAGYPFYTREFYELARDRLREGGVLCQWIPVHAMPVGLYTAFLRAFFEVFPEGSLWFFEQSTVLIGRKGTAQPSTQQVLARLGAVADDLADAGFEQPWLMLSGYVAKGVDVLALPTPPAYAPYADRPLRDMDPYPEFSPTPRAPLNTPYLHETLQYVFSLVEPEKEPHDRTWWMPEDGAAIRAGTRLALAGRWKDAEAQFLEIASRGLPLGSEAAEEREAMRLKALDDAAMAYGRALALIPGDRVLQWRRVSVFRRMAAIKTRSLLAVARALQADGQAGEAYERLVLAEGVARAALPPALADPDPVATHRIAAAALHTAVLLRLGRCERALRVLSQARVDLADEYREAPLTAMIDAVEAHAAGRAVTAPAGYAWVFADRVACRKEGTAPVQAELDALLGALTKGSLRAKRLAAKRLIGAARHEGSEAAVVAALAEAKGDAVLLAVVRRRIDPEDGTLRTLLGSENPLVKAAAIEQAGWWGLLRAHPGVMDAVVAEGDPYTKRALAGAAEKHGDVRVLRRVVELLMDGDESVRVEAFTIFARHRPNLIDGYDPLAPEAERRPAYERVRESLGG